MKELIFEITDKNNGHIYSIYSDGSIDGFGKECVVANYHAAIVDLLHAKHEVSSSNSAYNGAAQ